MADEKEFVEVSLDMSLDDIDDLPQFLVFPTGAYIVLLKEGFESKKIGEHPALTVALTLEEIVEIDPKALDKDEEPPKVGDVANLAFMLDNAIGAGKMKEFMKPLSDALDIKQLSEIVANSKGLRLAIAMTRSFDKAKGKHYQNFANVAVV